LSAPAVGDRLLDAFDRSTVGAVETLRIDQLEPTGDHARIDHRCEKLADAISTKAAFRA
jgi:hypothetical protein